MSARKIRMTAVGLVAMPAHVDERSITADDLASNRRGRDLYSAFAEVCHLRQVATDHAFAQMAWPPLPEVEAAWNSAQNAASQNDLEWLRDALTEARTAAAAAGLDTRAEDEALAMLPPVATREAA